MMPNGVEDDITYVIGLGKITTSNKSVYQDILDLDNDTRRFCLSETLGLDLDWKEGLRTFKRLSNAFE